MDPSDAVAAYPNVYPLHHHESFLNWLPHHSWKGIPQRALKYPSQVIIYTNPKKKNTNLGRRHRETQSARTRNENK
jgi:hypothetical protein